MKSKSHFSHTFAVAVMLGLAVALATSCSICCQKSPASPNTLSPQESAAGWRLLWDGKTTNGWRSAKGDYFPAKSWVMKDGVLTVHCDRQRGGPGTAGDIITRERFSNFELTADFKMTPGCNSGIKIFVQPDISPIDRVTGQKTAAGSAIGMEFQILDDERHPDAKLGRDGDRRLGSLYDLMPAPPSKVVMPMGEWNHMRIVSQGNHVTFWLNGEKTVELNVVHRNSAPLWPKVNSKIFLILASGRMVIFYYRNMGAKFPFAI